MFDILAQTSTSAADTSMSGGAVVVVLLLYVAVLVLSIAGLWKTFTKAGRPGWAAIVPVYNCWVLAEVAGKPGWWGLLLFIPIVNIVVTIILSLEIAKKFGKSAAFGIVGLWLFSIVGYAIIGFGDATYEGDDDTLAGAPQAPLSAENPQAPATPQWQQPTAPQAPQGPSDPTPPAGPSAPVV